MKKIAIAFQNGIGNFVELTPTIQALCEIFDAKADLVIDDNTWRDGRKFGVASLALGWDLIDAVILYDSAFKPEQYEYLYWTRHGERSGAFHHFKKVNPGGHKRTAHWRKSKEHEVEYYFGPLWEIGYRGPIPKQFVPTLEGKDFRKPGLNIGFSNGFFAGSRYRWERKAWPHFSKLAKTISWYYPEATVHLLGHGKVDEEWAKEMKGIRGIENWVGKLELIETATLISQLDLLVATDTGLMHIADALEVPLIALFGPTLVSKNGPYNDEHRIIRSSKKCVPCQQTHLYHSCPEFFEHKKWTCMEDIKPETVMAEVRDYLKVLDKRRPKIHLGPGLVLKSKDEKPKRRKPMPELTLPEVQKDEEERITLVMF